MKKHDHDHEEGDCCYEMTSDDVEKLLKEARDMLQKNPQHVESVMALVEYALSQDEFEQAIELIDKALKQTPDSYLLLFKKAMILLDEMQDIDLAFPILESLLNEFIHLSPEEIWQEFDEEIVLDTLLMVIDCYRLKKHFSMAFEMALKLKEILPQEEAAILALSTAHFEMGEYKKALFLLEPNIKENEDSDFLWQKAQIYCAQGEFIEADLIFKKAYELDEESYHCPKRLSQSEFFSFFEEALDEMPEDLQEVMKSYSTSIEAIVPHKLIMDNLGRISPLALATTLSDKSGKHITFFQKNIENVAVIIEDIKSVIIASLVYELENID